MNTPIDPEIGEESEVQKFFRGAKVFITGGTGFMGKVLVEKLLWSCPGVDTIYLLVRSKRGKNSQERIDELANLPCFGRLIERSPRFVTKLVAIHGDIGEVGLGLNDQDRQLLTEQVNVVFHVAATIRFEEKLATAIKQNVRATRDVLALCRMCARLKAVVHVSTMFSNYPLPSIQERFYETHVDCDRVLEMLESLRENIVNAMTKQLLGCLPNTYILTKSLAEQVIRRHGKGLPIAISRPAIVACSDHEPTDGWIDGYFGPAGLCAGIAAGVFRSTNLDGNVFANVVPCDLAINSIIVAACEVADKRCISPKEIPIYNFSSPVSSRITWRQYFDKYVSASRKMPSNTALWYPYFLLTTNKPVAMFLRCLLHAMTALLMDFGFKLLGKRARMCSTYSKMHHYLDITRIIASSAWNHDQRNVLALWAKTSPRDKELFPFDMTHFDWDSYIPRSFLGIRKYLMKEDEKTIPAAKIKMERLFWYHCSAIAVTSVVLGWIALQIFDFGVQLILQEANVSLVM